MGCDATIDYKNEDVGRRLREEALTASTCTSTTSAARSWTPASLRSRCAGGSSCVGRSRPPQRPRLDDGAANYRSLIIRRGRWRLHHLDYVGRFPEGPRRRWRAGWGAGKITSAEHIVEGLEHAP
jgi:hypothetical protein